MGYFLALVLTVGVMCVVGLTAMHIIKKRSEELIRHIKKSSNALREVDCIARNNCSDHGEYCRECGYYVKESYKF